MTLSPVDLAQRMNQPNTPKQWNELYEEHFGVEVPYTGIRDPNEHLDAVIGALYNNRKLVAVEIKKGMHDLQE
jgi:hypothetical protein